MELMKAITFVLNTRIFQIFNALLEKVLWNTASRLYISDCITIKTLGNRRDHVGFWIAAPLYNSIFQLVEEEENE